MEIMNRSERTPHLGIDFGGVIVTGATAGKDTPFFGPDEEQFLGVPPQQGAVESIVKLVSLFNQNVWIISKAGQKVQRRTRNWLTHRRFSESTGIPAQNVRFCADRAGKLDHCIELRITHFLDDRIHVMQILQNTVPHLFLFGPQKGGVARSRLWTAVADWQEAVHAIHDSL
jgi:hypothetical protein